MNSIISKKDIRIELVNHKLELFKNKTANREFCLNEFSVLKGDFKKNDVKSTLLVKNGLDLDEYFDTNDPFLKSEFSRIIKFNSDPR